MASTLAFVTPAVLRWARESIGYDLPEAARLSDIPEGRLAEAERGDARLTLPQAERVAALYDRPLVELLQPTIPNEPDPEVEFRQFPDTPTLPWPPSLVKLYRRISDLQQEAIDLYDELGEEPAWPTTAARLAEPALPALPRAARGLLAVNRAEVRSRDDYWSLRLWTDAIERLGVLVMQSGDVPTAVNRGFAAPSDRVPVIVLNTGDVPQARAFTLVHELGHLVLGIRQESVRDAEAWCDNFAGEALMPDDQVRAALSDTSEPIEQASLLSSRFGVTRLAAAVRLRRLRFISEAELADVRRFLRQQPESKSSRGGDHYSNVVARRGRTFLRLAFSALNHGVITYPHASYLMGAKCNHLATLRDQLEGRRQRGPRTAAEVE